MDVDIIIVRVPADFWKVAVAESVGGLRAVGYLHTRYQRGRLKSAMETFARRRESV